MTIRKIPSFDPNPSLKKAIKFLKEIGVENFALIGRVATWFYLPEDQHQFTKDVDLAVLTTDISKIEFALKSKGYEVLQLSIGGVAVRENDFFVDFIDRRTDRLDALFGEAIEYAQPNTEIGDETIKVVTLDYLIALKLVSGEPKDDLDVKALLQVEEIDYPKLRSFIIKHLGAATANRMDVLARDTGVLPPKKSYRVNKVS